MFWSGMVPNSFLILEKEYPKSINEAKLKIITMKWRTL
jgi:hypothetical protein